MYLSMTDFPRALTSLYTLFSAPSPPNLSPPLSETPSDCLSRCPPRILFPGHILSLSYPLLAILKIPSPCLEPSGATGELVTEPGDFSRPTYPYPCKHLHLQLDWHIGHSRLFCGPAWALMGNLWHRIFPLKTFWDIFISLSYLGPSG